MGHPHKTDCRLRLFEFLDSAFDVSGLHQLCLYLDIDPENLAGDSKRAKCLALITYLEHRGRLAEILPRLRDERPSRALEVSEIERLCGYFEPPAERQSDTYALPTFVDFTLRLDLAATGGYRATVVESPVGEATAICEIDLSSPALRGPLAHLAQWSDDRSRTLQADMSAAGADVGQMAERISREVVPGAFRSVVGADVAQMTERLGRDLFTGVFRDQVADVYRGSLGQVRGLQIGLRVRLQIEPPELAALPWEFLWDPLEDQPLSISTLTPLVRHVSLPVPARSGPVEPPWRILIVIANTSDTRILDSAKERALMGDALAESQARGLVLLNVLEVATVERIIDAVRVFRPHVFHFIGHGMFREDCGHIVLDDGGGHALPVSEKIFREFFPSHSETQLVILNACQTATTSSATLLTGMAPRLLQREIAAVVAMQYPILDTAAIIFAREFYRSLATGAPIDMATSEARRGIYLELGREFLDWAAPVLFLRARSGDRADIALPR
jgi:hypothetical protein